MTSKSIIPSLPRGFVKVEPDDDRWKNKFHVNSASSDRVYRISYDSAPGAGWWMCACRGCISHGSCKHLESIGLRPTRKQIMQNRIGTPDKGSTVKPPGTRRLGGSR
jgi:hypothetical protein